MSSIIKIALGADHAGYAYKEILKSFLTEFDVQDFGTYSAASVDYPDFAHPVADCVESGAATFGILVCGSANGVAITANKHQGVRAAICWETEIAELARKHNNANIICIPGRFVSESTAKEMVRTFLETSFEAGRHQDRVEKISC
ncbi:MAG: sugar-phosphate isomerase, RpiB/LacA/LacB family [Pedobacter sp.]|nr:sugar-phosphate isomerase, RpiB/LacA/LacB family [Pedobacter sp.]